MTKKKAVKKALKDALVFLGGLASIFAVIISTVVLWQYATGKEYTIFAAIGAMMLGTFVVFGIISTVMYVGVVEYIHERYGINKENKR